jgi:hypothetical protein
MWHNTGLYVIGDGRTLQSLVKRQYLQSVLEHSFIGFEAIVGAWRGRYIRLHNRDFYPKFLTLVYGCTEWSGNRKSFIYNCYMNVVHFIFKIMCML